MTREYRILNLGAGVQSTTLYLMSHHQEEPEFVPRFDYAIFADTQEEPRAVYEHLEWLKSLGGPPILTASHGKLGDEAIHGRPLQANPDATHYVSIPAFTAHEEGHPIGIRPRQCTERYKVRVVERTIRRDVLGIDAHHRVPGDVRIYQYFGLSFDEPTRIIGTKRRVATVTWSEARFPLFEMEMSRAGCLAYLEKAMPEGRTVPRSACTFCPYRSNAEWRWLRDHDPEGWARAIEIDGLLRAEGSRCRDGMEQAMYLHSSCLPLGQAPIDTPESRGEQYVFGFARECEGMCGV